MLQLLGVTARNQPNAPLATRRVFEDAGVHHRRVDAAVRAGNSNDDKPVVGSTQPGSQIKVGSHAVIAYTLRRAK